MAKKNKDTNNTAATVAETAASKVAEMTLRLNPDINEVHVTSDGTAFYTRNDAQNHANTLPNRSVYSAKRETLARAAQKDNGKKADAVITDDPKNPPAPDEVDELGGEAVNESENEPAKTEE